MRAALRGDLLSFVSILSSLEESTWPGSYCVKSKDLAESGSDTRYRNACKRGSWISKRSRRFGRRTETECLTADWRFDRVCITSSASPGGSYWISEIAESALCFYFLSLASSLTQVLLPPLA